MTDVGTNREGAYAPGSPEALESVRQMEEGLRMQREIDRLSRERERAEPEIRGIYFPKHVVLWMQVLRTVAAVVAASVNVCVLVVVLTR